MTDGNAKPPLVRIMGAGARGADRVAEATGINAAIDEAVEEAIVRAFRSPAMRQGLERALSEAGTEVELDPDEVATIVRRALESEAAAEMWAEILASRQAQMLVQRIADAPEVRAAIAAQGAGLIGDIGVRLTRITEALDDVIERFTRRREPSDHEHAGLATRSLAGAVDLGLLFLLYTAASSVLGSVVSATTRGTVPILVVAILTALAVVAAGVIVAGFWSLVGQTPGMRFLSIRIVHDGTSELGPRVATRRLVALLLALAPAGLGFLWIARNPERRGWHDLLADTQVVYDRRRRVAPHSARDATRTSTRLAP